MNILLVNYEYKPQCGGAGFATYNLAKELKQMGNEVELIVGWDYHFGKPEQIDNVNIHSISIRKKSIHESSPLGVLKFVLVGFFKINRLTRLNQYDVIMFYFSIPTGILKFAISGEVPYVCSLRGIDVPSHRKDKYVFLRKMLNFVNGRIVRDAAAVTALSSELALWFNRVYKDIPVTVIPNGVDIARFARKTSYSERVTRFVTVSRLIECKNIELSMMAFKKVHDAHPDIQLDIIGDGYLYNDLQAIIRNENMQDYIHLKGFMKPDEIYSSLQKYDVFYLLTMADSFGQVFIEAMACGLPVICADIGGPKDIVKQKETGLLVNPNDLLDTERALEYAIENSDLMKEYGINGAQTVERQFTIRSVAQRHMDLFETIV